MLKKRSTKKKWIYYFHDYCCFVFGIKKESKTKNKIGWHKKKVTWYIVITPAPEHSLVKRCKHGKGIVAINFP